MRLLKGTDPKVDSYSAFWDNNHTHQTKLFSELVDRDITDIVVCGLATDICVKFTSIDGQKHGFNTTVVLDACRGVAHEGIETARCEQQACGIKIIVSSEVSSLLA
uniref:nicotinamidase n=2 Tax=Clytia hemisphaerica TaxID=252671 RepID=A0A7M5VC97_9CNID